MSKPTARYSVTFGLRGCYMPDSVSGAFAVGTRRDLAAYIRAEMDMNDIPANRFAQVGIRALWRHIARYGSSSAHFAIDAQEGYVLEFHGLTEDEYNEQAEAND